MSEVKTWTLYQDNCNCCWLNENNGTEPIKVIEFADYQQLKAELSEEKQKVEKLCIAIRKVIEDAVIFDRLDANSLNRCINLMNRYGGSNE